MMVVVRKSRLVARHGRVMSRRHHRSSPRAFLASQDVAPPAPLYPPLQPIEHLHERQCHLTEARGGVLRYAVLPSHVHHVED